MAEWTKAPVLKTGDVQASVGSNPTPSASAASSRPCYVYVLRSLSEEARLYIGSTATPDERLRSHNAGKVRSTKHYRPWSRILLETHLTRSAALKRERYLKSGYGRRWLKRHLGL